MEAPALLRNRIAVVGAAARDQVTRAAGLDWTRPLFPGTSPLGLTLWHMPRTVDWLINTSVLDRPEVADDAAFSDLPDPDRYGFGTALGVDQAAEAAARVTPSSLLAYSEAVHATADEWLGSLSPADLDEVPDLLGRQQRRPSYSTPDALAEVEGLAGLPVGILLTRPTMGHLQMHLGEIDLLVQLASGAGELS